MSEKQRYQIKNPVSPEEMKQFLTIFDYWGKQGLTGFVPVKFLYKYQDQLRVLVDTEEKDKTADVVGIAWVIPRKRPCEFYQLKTLAIKHGLQGQGLGRLFLTSLIKNLQQQQPDYFMMTSVVSTNQPAITLYQSVGFEPLCKLTSKKGVETYEMIRGHVAPFTPSPQ